MWTVTRENSRSRRTHGRIHPCLSWVLGHPIVPLEDLVDAVVGDGDV